MLKEEREELLAAGISLKDLYEFSEVNIMRAALDMPLLKKGKVKCMGNLCGEEFLTLDIVGNRLCPKCKNRSQDNVYNDFQDAYSVIGV